MDLAPISELWESVLIDVHETVIEELVALLWVNVRKSFSQYNCGETKTRTHV